MKPSNRIFITLLVIILISSSLNQKIYAQEAVADSHSTALNDTTHYAAEPDTSAAGSTNLTPIKKVSEKLTDIFSPGKILSSIILILIGFYAIKLITKILDKISEKSARYRIGIKGLIPIVRIFGWTVVLSIIVVAIFAPPIESLVVVTGSFGIAIGFASQDLLKNIFGGIMIIFDRPFQVGDKVQIGEHYGEVRSIGLRSTRIVTPDDSMVSIPNGDVMSKSVSNTNSGETNCQVVADIFLPVWVDTQKAREIAVRSIQVSKYVYLNKPIVVLFQNEIHRGRSYLKMRMKAYVLDIRYEFMFLSDITEITMKELINQNIISEENFVR